MLSASKSGSGLATGYNLTRSLRFRSSATAYLNRTGVASPTNNKIWTWSGWAKRGQLNSAAGFILFGYVDMSTNYQDAIRFSNDGIGYIQYVAGTLTAQMQTTQVFRDPSAWYHIVVAVDTTQATASNRFKLYVNGSQVTSFSTATYAAQNQVGYLNTASTAQGIGCWYPYLTNSYYDGYLSEVNFVDGQQLTPSSFGSTNATTGVWQPARYTGTYGTNGFYLPFTDNSALTTSSNVGLGKDFSGNANYWVTNNISITAGATYDSMTDVPTLTSATAANFCVVNPLQYAGTLSNANLTYTNSSGASWQNAFSTFFVSSGKWYWEGTVSGGIYHIIGVATPEISNTFSWGTPASGNAWGYIDTSGNKLGPSNYSSGAAYGATYTSGDVIGVALDLDAGTITFYKNNTSQGVAFSTGLAGTLVTPIFSVYNSVAWNVNFGQRPFTYTPPTGYVALNTFNLPTSTIVKGNTVMDATTYTGTLLSNAITNAASFKPDLVWVKSRSAATDNKLTDSVRGVTKGLISNTTGAETTDTQGLTAFGSAGFTVGTNTDYNNLAATYVAWQWQAGQGSSSSNTNGTITSTVSVNASAGFSVVTYTGTQVAATVGHGLGVAPQFIVVKSRTNGIYGWAVYTSMTGAGNYLLLSATSASAAGSTTWNNTSPTSSVFSIGADVGTNKSGDAYVAYCWTPIAGFSAFGKYTANGVADGPFIYTGFRPKFIMVKNIDAANTNWTIIDTSRDTYNGMQNVLLAESSAAETVGTTPPYCDALANGFKLRSGNAYMNYSTTNYIYMAFAENPFKNALAR